MREHGEKPTLAIWDRDRNFGWRLSEYMNAKSGFPFTADAFTEGERLLEEMRRGQVEAVLMEESLLGEAPGPAIARGAPRCVLLTEETGRAGARESQSPYERVSKLQSAQKLMDQVLGCFAKSAGGGAYPLEDEREKPALVRERPAGRVPPGLTLVGVFSPVGRCGKTALALTLGEVLGEERRTLYLDLERYSGLKNLGIVQEGAGDLNDLLYYHRIDPDSLVYRLPGLVRTFRSLDYITPPLSGEDVMAVRAPEWLALFAALAAAGEYEAIVLDLGICLEEVLPVLGACTRILMPVLDDPLSLSKVEQFHQAAAQAGLSAMTGRIEQLRLPLIREELWGRDVSSRLVRGKLGAYVRKLL